MAAEAGLNWVSLILTELRVTRRAVVDDLQEIYDRWVKPVYMGFLHGNFRGNLLAEEPPADRNDKISVYRRCVREIDPAIVKTLLRQEWRARMSGAWYAGLRGWTEFADELGSLLVASETCYAGQGYCAALACFANQASADYLRRYLDRWLPQTDKYYDQHWALPALAWTDKRLNTDWSAKYLAKGGLWDRWAAVVHREGWEYYLESQHRFDITVASALAAFRAT